VIRTLGLLLALASGAVAAQTGHQPMHQRFDDAEKWAKVFDDAGRQEWQKPDEVIRALKLPPQAEVADVGAGTGYFAARLARALPEGKVYAADVEPGMVRYLRARAERENLPNLSATLAGTIGPNLPGAVDLILIVNTYHHIENRARYFANLKNSLKPGGRVAIVDFKPDSPMGPPPQHRISEQRLTAEMEAAGYRSAEKHPFLPYQYFIVFAPLQP
jgi:SAM-dependent methyltransferase